MLHDFLVFIFDVKPNNARLSGFRMKLQALFVVAKVEPQLWLVLPRCKTQVASLLYDTAVTFLPSLALPLSSFARQLSNSRPRCAYQGVPPVST